jgi:aspartyl-tRNA(Asn)/glutamyl-tRNA(Gln) amidotransferase subunit C
VITQQNLEKLAQLSRLSIEHQDKEKLLNDLNRILDWMQELQEIDTTDILPLTHLTSEINQFREDEVRNMLDIEKALQNAPKKDNSYIRVPKIIE